MVFQVDNSGVSTPTRGTRRAAICCGGAGRSSAAVRYRWRCPRPPAESPSAISQPSRQTRRAAAVVRGNGLGGGRRADHRQTFVSHPRRLVCIDLGLIPTIRGRRGAGAARIPSDRRDRPMLTTGLLGANGMTSASSVTARGLRRRVGVLVAHLGESGGRHLCAGSGPTTPGSGWRAVASLPGGVITTWVSCRSSLTGRKATPRHRRHHRAA